jgi:hypothetical protein
MFVNIAALESTKVNVFLSKWVTEREVVSAFPAEDKPEVSLTSADV